MKTYEEMAKDALERIDAQKKEIKKRRSLVMKIAIPAVCLCLTAVFGITAWQAGFFTEPELTPDTTAVQPYTSADSAAVTELTPTGIPDEQAVTGESQTIGADTPDAQTDVTGENVTGTAETTAAAPADSGNKGSVDTVSDCAILRWNNKLDVSGALYYAMQADPYGTFSVTASYHPVTSEITDFVYEGKTLAERAVASEDARFTLQKMHELLKQGEELKYGSALYETGTPDGIKWDKNFYEERIKYFGSLIDKYIVNGEFLHEQLSRDITEYDTETVVETYALAYNAYLETILPEILQELSQSGISCTRAPYSTSGIVVDVTPAQLENLPLPDPTQWSFGLASDGTKGNATDEAVVHNAGNAG